MIAFAQIPKLMFKKNDEGCVLKKAKELGAFENFQNTKKVDKK